MLDLARVAARNRAYRPRREEEEEESRNATEFVETDIADVVEFLQEREAISLFDGGQIAENSKLLALEAGRRRYRIFKRIEG